MAQPTDIVNPYGETYSEKQRREKFQKTLNNQREADGEAPVGVGPDANADAGSPPESDFPVAAQVTDRDIRYQEEKQAATSDTPGFWESWGLAREETNAVPYIEKQLTGDELPDDPEYRVTEKEWQQATQGIPESYLDELTDVKSHGQLIHQADEIRQSLSRQRRLASAGMTGYAAALGAGIFNEENLALIGLSAATDGAAGVLGFGYKASRFARITQGVLSGAAVGASENAAVQAYIASQSQTQGLDTVLNAAALGGALGGAAGGTFGALGRHLPPVEGEAAARYHADDDAFESLSGDMHRAINDKDFVDAQRLVDEHISPDGKAHFVDQVESMKENHRRSNRLKENIEAAERRLAKARSETPVEDIVARRPRPKKTLEELGGVSSLSRALGKTVDSISPDTERLYHALLPEAKAKHLTRTSARQLRKQYDQRVRTAQRDQAQRIARLEDDVNKLKDEKDAADATLSQQQQDFGSDLSLYSKLSPDAGQSVNAAKAENVSVPEQVRQEADVPDDWGVGGYKPVASSIQIGERRIRTRFDPFATLVDQDYSPTMRGYARAILPDPVGTSARSGDTTKVAASEFSQAYFSGRVLRWNNRNRAAIRKWSQATGKSQRWEENVHEFQTKVHRQVERGDVDEPGVAEAAAAWADLPAFFLQEFKRLGRTGFDEIDENSNYVPRMWRPDKFVEANNHPAIGMVTVRKAMRAAIRKNQPDIEDELADKLTEAIIKRKHAEGHGIDPDFNRGIFSRDENEMRTALRAADMDEDEIQSLIDSLKKSDGESAKDGRAGTAKHRISMDVYEEVTDLDGNPFSVSMLMETDMQRIAERYVRQSSGVVGYLKAMRNEGITGDIEPMNYHRKVVNQIRSEIDDKAKADDYAKRLDRSFSVLMGTPIENTVGPLNTSVRFANSLAYAAYAGQFGIAQVPEMANLVSELGFRNTMKSVPLLRTISKRAQNGELDDEAAREMLDMGVGLDDRMMNQPRSHQDTDFQSEQGGKWVSSKTVETADRWGQKTTRAVGDLSGMNGINLMFNKMMAAMMGNHFHRLARKLAKGGKLSESERSRMRNIGLTNDQQDQVLKYIRKHGRRTKEGTLTLGIKHWHKETPKAGEMDPTDLRDLFHGAVYKMSSNIIQRNNPNDLPPLIFDTIVGRTLMQFRSFVMNAWAKQTLRHVNQADRVMVSALLVSTFLGGVSQIGRVYVNSLGEDNPEQYRRDRLSDQAIAYAAVTRTGMSSIIPMVASPSLYMAGLIDKPIGQYARTSGLGQDPVTGSPVYQMGFKALPDALSGGVQTAAASVGVGDHQFSQRDFQAFKSLTPFQNAWGVRNILAHMGKGLPDDRVNDIRTGSDWIPLDD